MRIAMIGTAMWGWFPSAHGPIERDWHPSAMATSLHQAGSDERRQAASAPASFCFSMMAAWMIGADRQHHLIMRDSDNAPIRRYDQRFVEVMLKKERINWKGPSSRSCRP